jgi:hypothetical protein
VKIHRAITLVVMMLLGLAALALLMANSASHLDSGGLIALGVVVLAAAAGGVGFSWNRYFKRR